MPSVKKLSAILRLRSWEAAKPPITAWLVSWKVLMSVQTASCTLFSGMALLSFCGKAWVFENRSFRTVLLYPDWLDIDASVDADRLGGHIVTFGDDIAHARGDF